MKRIPAKDRHEAMLRELERAADGLIEVANAVDKGLERLGKMVQEVEEAIEARSNKSSGPPAPRKKKSKAKSSQPAKSKATKKSARKRTR